MKKILPVMLSLLMLGGCAAPASRGVYQQITMEDALQLMEKESGYILLDVRTQAEYAGGHIPGAINIPNEHIGQSEIAQLPKKDQLILVYCRSGNRSKQAASKLAAMGYNRIVEIGGIYDWPGDLVYEDAE